MGSSDNLGGTSPRRFRRLNHVRGIAPARRAGDGAAVLCQGIRGDQAAEQFGGCCLRGSIGSFGKVIEHPTARDPKLAADINALCRGMCRLFDVRVLAIVVNENGAPNACATAATFPELVRSRGGDPADYSDGTVMLGWKLLRSEYMNGRYGKYAIPAIIAHE